MNQIIHSCHSSVRDDLFKITYKRFTDNCRNADNNAKRSLVVREDLKLIAIKSKWYYVSHAEMTNNCSPEKLSGAETYTTGSSAPQINLTYTRIWVEQTTRGFSVSVISNNHVL